MPRLRPPLRGGAGRRGPGPGGLHRPRAGSTASSGGNGAGTQTGTSLGGISPAAVLLLGAGTFILKFPRRAPRRQ